MRRPAPALASAAARGLTLLELMMTLGVIAVLASLAVPSFGQQLDRHRLKAAAEHLAADLAEARFEAARRGVPLHLSFAPGAAWCYAISATPGCDCQSAQPCQLKTVRSADLPGIRLLASRDALLDPGGVAPLAAGALLGTQQGEQLRVAMSALGRARVCAPAGTVGTYPHC